MTRRIMIIDDEAMIRDVVMRILKLKGHIGVPIASGDEAIKYLQNDPNFDFIVLDLNMPGQHSGENTFYYVIKNFPEIKIIISSGFIDDDLRKKLLSDGAEVILEKPYKIDEILEIIK